MIVPFFLFSLPYSNQRSSSLHLIGSLVADLKFTVHLAEFGLMSDKVYGCSRAIAAGDGSFGL